MNRLERDLTVGMADASMTERRADYRRRTNQRRRRGPMSADASAVLSVRMPNRLFDDIDALAKQDRLEVAELVRGLLEREVRHRLRRLM